MAEEKKGMSKGCLIALIVGLVILFIIVAAGVVCYVYRDELGDMFLTKMTDKISVDIKANLPEGVSSDDVDKTIDDFKKAFKDGKIDQAEIQKISETVQKAFEDKKISQEEGKEILKELKEAVTN
jgi:tape measure domain-containing protein